MNHFLSYCLSLITDQAQQSKFERLYYAHRHAMLYVSNQILHDQSLAEDAVQEAFLRILKHLDKIDENNCHKAKAFMVIVVKNISINMYNKRKKQNEVFLFDDSVASTLIEENTGFDNEHLIATYIKQLPETYAHIMALRYLYELNDTECAKLLKLTESTVRKRLERGRKLLKDRLQREGVEAIV